MKRIGPDECALVRLQARDCELLLEHALLFEPLHSLVGDAAPGPGGKVTVQLTPDDLDELIAQVAFAANHTDRPALQSRFDELYDRLTEVERGLDVRE